MKYGKTILDKWYLDKNITYLNHGSFGATPVEVILQGRKIEEEMESELISFFTDKYPVYYKNSIKKICDFLNLKPENTALVENATTGINNILNSIEFLINKGDKILITNHTYPAIKNTLDYFCKRNEVKIEILDIPLPYSDDEFLTKLTKVNYDKVKIAILDHISSATAIVFPIKKAIKILQKNNVISIIDGAHAPGMINPQIEELNCDFYTGNMHKWAFAQKGAALLWANKKWHQILHPNTISHYYLKGFPMEFEWIGTRNPVSWFSLPKAIDFYYDNGNDEIKNYNHNLILESGKMINDYFGNEQLVPDENIGSIFTIKYSKNINHTKENVELLRKLLLEKFNIEVMFLLFENQIYFRISSQIYNEPNDYEKLLIALKDIN